MLSLVLIFLLSFYPSPPQIFKHIHQKIIYLSWGLFLKKGQRDGTRVILLCASCVSRHSCPSPQFCFPSFLVTPAHPLGYLFFLPSGFDSVVIVICGGQFCVTSSPSKWIKQNTITFNIPLLPWLIVESSCQVCKTNPHTTYFHCIYSIAIPPPALIVDHYLFFYGLAWPQYEYWN